MSRLMEALEDYGADVAGALERFVDDEELYTDCLADFAADPGVEALKQAFVQGDIRAAFMNAHTLKGVAANLGLTPLFSSISALVEPLRAGSMDNLEGCLQEFLEEYQRFVSLVEQAKQS